MFYNIVRLGGENSKAKVKAVVRAQCDVFKENEVDLMILEVGYS